MCQLFPDPISILRAGISNSMPWARQTRCGSEFWPRRPLLRLAPSGVGGSAVCRGGAGAPHPRPPALCSASADRLQFLGVGVGFMSPGGCAPPHTHQDPRAPRLGGAQRPDTPLLSALALPCALRLLTAPRRHTATSQLDQTKSRVGLEPRTVPPSPGLALQLRRHPAYTIRGLPPCPPSARLPGHEAAAYP